MIPIEIEATIDAAMQTNDQTDPKALGLIASDTAALSLQTRTRILQLSFRRGLTRRGAERRAILRRKRWRGFCSLCSGSGGFGWHFASPHCLPYHFFHWYSIASHWSLFNFFFFLFFPRFLTTPMIRRHK